MAVIMFSGWEEGDLSTFSGTAGTCSVSTSTVRTGVYSFRSNPTTTQTGYGSFSKTDAAGQQQSFSAIATGFIRVYINIATLPAASNEEFLTYTATSGTQKCSFRISSAGKIDFYRAGTTLVASGTTVLSTGTWYLIETKVGTSASGAYELKINGVSEYSGTASLGASNDYFNCGKEVNRNGKGYDIFFDDFAVSDSGYLGAGACYRLAPAANGTSQTFTIGAGSGSHFQVVNSVPQPGNTSYLLSTAIATNAETEQAQTRSQGRIAVTSVNCVKSTIWVAQNTTSGSIQNRFRSNTTNTDGAAFAPGASYQMLTLLYNTDPAGGSWTAAALDTLQVGAVEASSSVKTRMSAADIYVDGVISPVTFSPGVVNSNFGDGFTTC